MSESKALLIITAIVNKENIAEFPTYLEGVTPILGKNGGKPVGKYTTIEQLAGEKGPEIISILEFPSADAIREMVTGEEFQSLSELRARVFSKLNLLISA